VKKRKSLREKEKVYVKKRNQSHEVIRETLGGSQSRAQYGVLEVTLSEPGKILKRQTHIT
jgi:hypothetical protein